MKRKIMNQRNFDLCQNFLTILKCLVLQKILQLNQRIHRINNNSSIQKFLFNSNNRKLFQVNTKKELKKKLNKRK